MDRTLIAVHNMLAAIHTPTYDIGILSDRGMLPGLANLSAAKVLSRIPLLKAHNAKRGAHLHPPSGRAPLHCARRPQPGFGGQAYGRRLRAMCRGRN